MNRFMFHNKQTDKKMKNVQTSITNLFLHFFPFNLVNQNNTNSMSLKDLFTIRWWSKNKANLYLSMTTTTKQNSFVDKQSTTKKKRRKKIWNDNDNDAFLIKKKKQARWQAMKKKFSFSSCCLIRLVFISIILMMMVMKKALNLVHRLIDYIVDRIFSSRFSTLEILCVVFFLFFYYYYSHFFSTSRIFFPNSRQSHVSEMYLVWGINIDDDDDDDEMTVKTKQNTENNCHHHHHDDHVDVII